MGNDAGYKIFLDDEGFHVFTSQGIGEGPRAPWIVVRKRRGAGSHRIKARELGPMMNRDALERNLRIYAAEKGWQEVPTRHMAPAAIDFITGGENMKKHEEKKSEIMPAAAADRELARLEADAKLVEERFGDGEPYEFERVLRRAEAAKLQAADAVIEIGRCLLRVKANEGQERFSNALEKLSLQESSGYLYMGLAVKFGDTKKLKALPIRKLDILGQLPEADLKKLETKGSLGDLRADDLDRMTAEELRAEVKKLRNFKKKASDQYSQVKQERDYLKENTGVPAEFDRLTGANLRCFAAIQNLDLSEIGLDALDKFLDLAQANVAKLRKRVHPEQAGQHDGDAEEGKVEARRRESRKGAAAAE